MRSLRGDERLFASAMLVEHFAAQRLGESLLVGIACKKVLPTRPVISFGFAGALSTDLAIGTVVVATKVVDQNGKVLWEGVPLTVPGAVNCVVLASDRFIDSAEERMHCCKESGATVVDMESGVYARLGLFTGGLRVISDTPSQRLISLKGPWFGGTALWALNKVRF